MSPVSRLKNIFFGSSLILGLGLIYAYITDTRASAHRWLVVPALRLVYPDPEAAHEAGNHALKTLWQFGLYVRERGDPDRNGDLAVEVFGHSLRNPIATSAGIDKHADIPDPLFAVGPAIVELGGTTPMPQNGNEKPRVFRLPSQNALINRYGLNSEGADHVAMRLRHRVREFAHAIGFGSDAAAEKMVLDGHAGVPPGSLIPGKLLAVNIAKNKTTPEHDVEAVASDYVYCVERLAPYADILVVNVSSPNTPGLRTLQQTEPLKKILRAVVSAAQQVDRVTKPAVMVKVSPDEDTDEQIAGICEAVWDSGVDGVIVGNTTNRRPEPLPCLPKLSPREEQHLLETGGFSGPHLFERTVSLVKKYRKLLNDPPERIQLPGRSRQALEQEAKKLRESIEGLNKSDEAPKSDSVATSIDTGVTPLGSPPERAESEKSSLVDPPEKLQSDQSVAERDRLKSIYEALENLPSGMERSAEQDQPKVIFATGGITNGTQALEVLNAGASVAMVYTALVYGGIGTISRIKGEMRAKMKTKSKARTKS